MATPEPLRTAPPVPLASAFALDVLAGLASQPKRIASKYFYDAQGSALFERICTQPEYYPTRTELAILRDCGEELAAAIGPRARVVEYGSGSGLKTALLLSALIDPVAYVPVEISHSALRGSVESLGSEFPEIEIAPLRADFTDSLTLPPSRRLSERTVVFFPGSTIGNFETQRATALLATMRANIGPRGLAVVGIDLLKDPAILEAAYNDAAGVTAEFTLNLLARMNRELGADFQLAQFRHRATFNPLAGRIETHIVSRIDQDVRVAEHSFHFAAGEAMLVEYSCKYSQAGFERMAADAGLRVVRTWTDPQQWFAIELLELAT